MSSTEETTRSSAAARPDERPKRDADDDAPSTGDPSRREKASKADMLAHIKFLADELRARREWQEQLQQQVRQLQQELQQQQQQRQQQPQQPQQQRQQQPQQQLPQRQWCVIS